jgi:phosphoadenosine phosphosulfate reductase
MNTTVDEVTSLIEVELTAAARPCVTCSFQADCLVLLHMVRRHAPDIPVLFLDTLHHFPETLAFAETIAREWRLNLVTLRAAQPSVGLWQTNVDACCARHKVAPLFEALGRYDTWFAGLRREQSRSRTSLVEAASVTLPSGHTLRKVSPLASWTSSRVSAYITEHRIPLLPLYARGYTSIGCAPCTTPPVDSNDARSGRWQGKKLECGIHVGVGVASTEGVTR